MLISAHARFGLINPKHLSIPAHARFGPRSFRIDKSETSAGLVSPPGEGKLFAYEYLLSIFESSVLCSFKEISIKEYC
ncbi:MAG: hypothetical protein DRI57_10940 [Deltaproteobacteria bacterium]|nr:MAG: hypothetical protein DRI57_10940 [Deltaproteobacteria bacterium]